MNPDDVLLAYVSCALWCSYDEAGVPLDALPREVSGEARETMRADVATFLETCDDEQLDLSALDPEQVGHDLWLTRNRHGAGFWDRGLGDLGDRLTELAHAYGDCDLYVGDDGLVYVS